MNIYESLMKSISPSMGLGLLRVGIEKKLGHKIDRYNMTYIAEKEKIFFTVPVTTGKITHEITEEYNSAGKDKIIFIIKNLCKTKLTDGESIDFVRLLYTLQSTDVEMGVTYKDGTKTKLTHKL